MYGVADRLARVSLECRDTLEVIAAHGRSGGVMRCHGRHLEILSVTPAVG
ncbi:hypothetical protein M878_44050 [Streptomyces roseochromogenus subsp. oscitans DS 12.976]|uniref:Uncharacterized protein n=1 Tax=Streptomyces roseochromogenus subsp. oscitans DS 12.976 TaxID=1352936 RepID=V6JG60_STRRC|nr:hypothetical protein M878_44050 [Streptomyces roseochromogenus subsp. oscitans DS 12.976]